LNSIEPLERAGADFGTDTLVEIEKQNIEPGDHERFSHYVKKDKIVESAVMGTPVVALCGKVWIPGRDPGKFPVCPTCKEIHEMMKPGKPEDENNS
jgi:hypothetical protein